MRWRQRQRGCGSLAAVMAASLVAEGAAWRKRNFVGSDSALESATTAATLTAVAARCPKLSNSGLDAEDFTSFPVEGKM